SNKTMIVSDAPLVVMVNLRDSVGCSRKSTCSPAPKETATDWNGCKILGLAFCGGYHVRTQSLSGLDSVAGGKSPFTSYWSGSSMRPGSNSYSMIESGSH